MDVVRNNARIQSEEFDTKCTCISLYILQWQEHLFNFQQKKKVHKDKCKTGWNPQAKGDNNNWKQIKVNIEKARRVTKLTHGRSRKRLQLIGGKANNVATPYSRALCIVRLFIYFSLHESFSKMCCILTVKYELLKKKKFQIKKRCEDLCKRSKEQREYCTPTWHFFTICTVG